MRTKKSKKKKPQPSPRYSASVVCRVMLDIPLKSETFEGAVLEAQALKPHDCVTFKSEDGSYFDGNVLISNVTDNAVYSKLDN